ncbi:MAG: MFS transporter [Paracoccaceae bacterium]|nr:MFS transporter [Paracoccaceae bacterium]
MPMTATRSPLFTPLLIAGSVVLILSFAIRSSFGVFQLPVAQLHGWDRSAFSLAIAIQNLAWGVGQPIFGALAEKIGDRKALTLGALLYAGGLVLTSGAATPAAYQLYEVMVGFGIAGIGFGTILALIGRSAAPEHRSLSLGLATAAGSLGQVIGPLAAEALLAHLPVATVFLVFAAAILSSLLLLPFLHAPMHPQAAGAVEPMTTVVARAFRDPSFTLIFLGFFSCGYQLGFITAHFPAFVTEVCGAIDPRGPLAAFGISTTSALGAASIAFIGVANIGGTLLAGWLGKRYSKKYLLAGVYLLRTMVASAFILTPMTPATVVLFALAMGALWLATVPLTSGLVAQIYGVRYMGTLYGIVFFSHQLGSFIGVWLGGRLYDLYGNYTLVWWVGIGVGAFSALVHLPVQERPMELRTART